MTIDWQTAAAIAEVVGGIAVVISLIYLAYQVRQNTRAIRGATLDSVTSHMKSELRWSGEMAPIWKKVFREPDTLTFEEAWELGEWTNASLTARQNEFHQFRHGLLDEDVWEASENIIRLLMCIDWIRNWWNEHGRHDKSAEFAALVDRLAEAGGRDSMKELDAVFAYSKE